MQAKSAPENTDRKKLLLIAVLTTLFSLFPTAYAALTSNSVALLADLLRCSGEFLAILVSWIILKRVSKPEAARFNYGYGKLEQFSSLIVGLAMLLSFSAVTIVSIQRWLNPQPLSGAQLGFGLAILSVLGNVYMWKRNYAANLREPSPLLDSQWRLFRGKAVASIVVAISVGLGLVGAAESWLTYADPIGSLVVALFLLYSAHNILSNSMGDLLDRAVDEALQFTVLKVLVQNEANYHGFHGVRSRRSGAKLYLELFLEFAPQQTIKEVQENVALLKLCLENAIPNADVSVSLASSQ